MGKRILTALLAALLLAGTALAAETPQFPDPPPVDPVDGDEVQLSGILPAAEVGWTGGGSYGDRLTGLARDVYERLEQAFRQGTVQYGSYAAFTDAPYCAYYEADWRDYTGADVKAEAEKYSPAVKEAYYAFHLDHPEYFWIRLHGLGWMSWRNVGGQTRLVIRVGYVLHSDYQSAAARDGFRQQVEASVQAILNGCAGQPALAQLAYFDNWLAANNTYNSAAADTENYIRQDQTPWNTLGALLSEYSPVCEGYAKAFQLLCHRIGVSCVPVSSQGHMWNALEVDGAWYYMDCTWNDPGESDSSSRQYFLVHQFEDSSHNVNQLLTAPAVAERDYFDTVLYFTGNAGNAEPVPGSSRWAALYNGDGRMTVLTSSCVSIPWKKQGSGGMTLRILPEFSAAALHTAAGGKLFTTGADWTPLEAVLTRPVSS